MHATHGRCTVTCACDGRIPVEGEDDCMYMTGAVSWKARCPSSSPCSWPWKEHGFYATCRPLTVNPQVSCCSGFSLKATVAALIYFALLRIRSPHPEQRLEYLGHKKKA